MTRSLPLLLALFSANTALAQEAVPASGTVEAPKMQAGDWWIRKPASGGWYRERVTKVSEDGGFETVSGREKAKRVFDAKYHKTEAYDQNLRSVWFNPSYCQLSFPLHPGKKWECTVTVIYASGGGNEMRVSGSAVGWEEIVLPGKDGRELKLSAMRIEYEHLIGGTAEKFTCWYAAGMKALARCDHPNPIHGFSIGEFGVGAGTAAK